ncbi:N-acetylglucosamine-6-phosphate deacetylase [Herbiconiux ginsengi]|uniref:N-acetylglucosamine 6-phosphate deacetylase n=1 Tax=Herbiconiux ginsengi TaxID=381665 RepID=A0A1H3JSF0_9MICO|nr:N-acetylglucosamine-6-phosphate deacetylase [Herbiconiux ginsengi]SDY42900.1 N-acetylglucosamine 6-phosphate deacetylase [Herbiconiux ginsengi]
MSIVVHSGRKADADGLVDDFWFLAEGDRIQRTGTGEGWREHLAAETEVVDASGLWLTPGFIDIHSHGGAGHSFDDGTESIQAALALHRRHGTTRSVISLVANPMPSLLVGLETVASLADNDPLILGAHLEGPFLARNHRGAHNPDFLHSPTSEEVSLMIARGRGHLVQITIAPELPGSLEAIDAFVAAGVVVAVGHTDADLALTREAFDRGATLLTHAFNAMAGIRHREPGPVVAAFDDPRVGLELIVDGFHVHPDVVKMAFRIAPDRIVLITDAMAAAGSVDGHYRLGTLNVSVADGRAVLSGTSTIAGSTLTQDAALRWAVGASGIDPVLAIAALTANPARAIRRDHDLGYLRPGYAADAVLLDADWTVQSVLAAGRRL